MEERSILEDFKTSLRQAVDNRVLKQYDQWVVLSEKAASLLITAIGIVFAYSSYVMGMETSIPIIYGLALAILGASVSGIIGILYRHAIASEDVYRRIIIVLFGGFSLGFGIPGTFLTSLYLMSTSTAENPLSLIIVFAIFYVVLLVWGFCMDSLLRSFVCSRTRKLLLAGIRPFNEILCSVFTRGIHRIRALAYGICSIFAALIWMLLTPAALPMFAYVIASSTIIWFLGRKQELEYQVTYDGIGEQIDIAKFSLIIASQIVSFGIFDYEVSQARQFRGHVTAWTTEIHPDGFEPIMVLHSSLSSIDRRKIKSFLREQWEPSTQVTPIGPYLCPFRPFDGRTLVDVQVWNAESLLWWGLDRRVALIVRGEVLRRLDISNGDFTRFFTYAP